MNFFFNSNGSKKPVFPVGQEILAEFLVSDVQSSINWSNELLAIIQAIKIGQLSEWSGTGNAFTLDLALSGASITNEYTEENLNGLELDYLAQVIAGWRDSFII